MNIKNTYTKVFLQAANQPINEETITKYKKLWWFNFRDKDSGGLRLTEEGIRFIKEEAKIKIYTIEFPKDFEFTSQVLLWLDKFIDGPFFITKKNITVLREISAFELYLFSGDVRKMGYNKALAKRHSQECHSL